MPICHHFTICNVQRISLGDQQRLVASEEEISSSKQAVVFFIPCNNERDAIRQKMPFTPYPELACTSFMANELVYDSCKIVAFEIRTHQKKKKCFRLKLRGLRGSMGKVFQSYSFRMLTVSCGVVESGVENMTTKSKS